MQSTPMQMPRESVGICGRLTQDLPLGQGGTAPPSSPSEASPSRIAHASPICTSLAKASRWVNAISVTTIHTTGPNLPPLPPRPCLAPLQDPALHLPTLPLSMTGFVALSGAGTDGGIPRGNVPRLVSQNLLLQGQKPLLRSHRAPRGDRFAVKKGGVYFDQFVREFGRARN